MPFCKRMLVAAVAGAFGAPALSAAQLQVSTGVEYSRGDYGELTATEAIVVPFSARVSFGSFSMRASVPWLSVRGPADIAPVVDDDGGDRGSNSGSGSSGSGSGSGGNSGPGGGDDDDEDDEDPEDEEDEDRSFPADREVQGLGDATLSAAWSFKDVGGSRWYLDLTGRVRLPSGDDARGLGRGTTDYATLAEIGWDGDGGGMFLLGGRQYLESTATATRRDTWQASAGGWMNLGRSSLVGVQGNWREASRPGGVDPRSVDVFVNVGMARGWRLDVSGSAGLSRASPDFVAGFGVSWRSARR